MGGTFRKHREGDNWMQNFSRKT